MIKKLVARRGRTDVDMTQGNIFSLLLNFAMPLLIGNLFQQFYNTVDTWVIGNYVENEYAFAAVGSVGPIMNMMIGIFIGLSSGAGVVISQYYGAKMYDKVKKAVHTAIFMTLVGAVVLTLLGVFLTPYLLTFMKMPEAAFPEAKKYLTIYFLGITGLVFYNMGSGILRAVGDSKRPFYFLVVSALLNTVLDLVFVILFGMGVEGVALATVIAQCVSAFLVLLVLRKTTSCVKYSPELLSCDRDSLVRIVRVGIPAALQFTITAFSNIFVQSYINFFNTDCMSGWTAYLKIDQFMFLPMQSLSIAATTFVGQNLGKGNVKRAKKGVNIAIAMSVISTLIIMIPVMIFAPYLVKFFYDSPAVIEYGTLFLTYLTPFYLACCLNQVYAGALRGAGNTRAPMLIMLISFVGFRQLYLYVMANYISNTILPIAFAYPAGWVLCSLIYFIYYSRVNLEKTRVV